MWNLEYSPEPITQVSVPITIVFPIGYQFNLTILHTPALSTFGEFKIEGLSDTWIHGAYMLWNEKLMVNVGLGAPTGKTRLKGGPDNADYIENNEFALSRWLSLNVLRFQLPVYGQGLCGIAGVTLAIPIQENLVIGLGGQYLLRNPYHPIEYQYQVGDIIRTSDEVYQPGNEVSGQFGFDMQIIDNTKIMLDGIYTYYWADRFSDVEVYGSGQKIAAQLGFIYQFDEKFFSSQFLVRYRGKNKLLQELNIDFEEKNRNGLEMEVDLIYKVVSNPKFSIFIYGDGRFIERNEFDEVGKASVAGGGFGMDYKANDYWVVNFTLKYLSGRLYTTLGERRTAGIDIYFGFQYMY
ncbi:hypothetical protein JW824_11110 [bacterium]|nr:hypothetical protein [bacterium]